MDIGAIRRESIVYECFALDQCKVFTISPNSSEVDGCETLTCLIREMYAANCAFLHNLSLIFECFAAGRLYGLRLEETQAMWEHQGCEPIFMQMRSPWTLPAFCCVDKDGCVELLWVHPRARHNGFVGIFARQLGLEAESLRKNFVLCNKNGKCNSQGYPDPFHKRVCNHWALTGFPCVRESHWEVTRMVLERPDEFNPWHACAVCNAGEHRRSKDRPAS